MKRRMISTALAFLMTVMLIFSMPFSVYAGSIPDDLSMDSNTKVFFAKVTEFKPNGEKKANSEYYTMTVVPVKIVCGDVALDTPIILDNVWRVEGFKPKKNMAYLFAVNDMHDAGAYAFKVSSYDNSTLKLVDLPAWNEHDMWKRFEEDLNEGVYEELELKRRQELNIEGPVIQEISDLPPLDSRHIIDIDDVAHFISQNITAFFIGGILFVILAITGIVFLVKRKIKKRKIKNNG